MLIPNGKEAVPFMQHQRLYPENAQVHVVLVCGSQPTQPFKKISSNRPPRLHFLRITSRHYSHMLMRWLARSLTKLLFPVLRLFISDRKLVGPERYTVGNCQRLKLLFNYMLKMIRCVLLCSSRSEQLCLR